MIGGMDELAQIVLNLDRRLREAVNVEHKLQAWVVPTLAGGWANSGAPYAPAGYWKDLNAIVWLHGRVTGGSVPSTIFTLPVKYRPQYTLSFYVAPSGAVVTVDATGAVAVASGATPVSLDNISFRAYA